MGGFLFCLARTVVGAGSSGGQIWLSGEPAGAGGAPAQPKAETPVLGGSRPPNPARRGVAESQHFLPVLRSVLTVRMPSRLLSCTHFLCLPLSLSLSNLSLPSRSDSRL